MPDLSALLDPPSLALTPYADPLSDPCRSDAFPHEIVGAAEAPGKLNDFCCIWGSRLGYSFLTENKSCLGKEQEVIGGPGKNKRRLARNVVMEKKKKPATVTSMEDHVKMWIQRKVASGVPEKECCLPFLNNAPKAVECRSCSKVIYAGEEIPCSVRGCEEAYHKTCAMPINGVSSSKRFTCPVHACFACKKKGYYWRCVKCTIAAHHKCEAWPDDVIHLRGEPRRAVCWMHHADWRMEKKDDLLTGLLDLLDKQHAVATSDIEEFDIDLLHMDVLKNESEPTPYVHIRRNIYLVKKKRSDVDADGGCTNCKDKTCSEGCVCRFQSISCSKACNCSETCTNRPFRKEKRIKVVKTQSCGWGVVAAESIKKGEFIIEYIGEVIDDALCEQRLWEMKYSGDENFYMCEIRKDFTIDATFKGNSSRFLNHSCDPNCQLEKWQVDGETRLGVFASKSIKAGQPLTYDYRFVHFGPMVRCCCGAKNCHGYLGSKKKQDIMNLCWGKKRQRSKAYVIS